MKIRRKVIEENALFVEMGEILSTDECVTDPCINGATCSDQATGYSCQCESDTSYCENNTSKWQDTQEKEGLQPK